MVLVLFYDRIGSRVPVREHRILTDQDCGSRAQDLRGAPVVLPKLDHRGTREVGGEAVQVVGVGTVPGVDGLVRIAHDAEVGSTVQPRREEHELQRVDVLELVHEEVAETPPLCIGETPVGGHGATTQVEQVVEVDHPTGRLQLLVVLEDAGDGREGERRGAIGGFGGTLVGPRPDAPRLGPLDLADHVQCCGGPVVAGQEGSDEAHLADQQLRLPPVVLPPPGPQLGVRNRVEGPGGHLVAHPDPSEAAAHLRCRLSRERQGQYPAGVDLACQRPPGDAVGQDPGLAGPGSGVDGQRHGFGGHRLALLLVQATEQRLGIGVVGGGTEEVAAITLRVARWILGSVRHAHRAHPSDGP